MTPEEAAAAMSGAEYGEEGSKELFAKMKVAGLVAVFGASDDLMEFRGAIDDEVGCYEGGAAYLTEKGLLTSECDEGEDCPYFARLQKEARTIRALWCKEDNISWTYETDIPHATFQTVEDGHPYCRGIVFKLSDAGPQ